MPSLKGIELEIAAVLDCDESELSEEDKEKFHAYLDTLATCEQEKADNLGFFLKHIDSRIDTLSEWIKDLTAKKKALENKKEGIKSYYVGVMKSHGIKKIQGDVYSLSLRNTSVVTVNCPAEKLPEEFKRTKVTVEAEKSKLKEAIKNGSMIPNVVLEEKTSLIVR